MQTNLKSTEAFTAEYIGNLVLENFSMKSQLLRLSAENNSLRAALVAKPDSKAAIDLAGESASGASLQASEK